MDSHSLRDSYRMAATNMRIEDIVNGINNGDENMEMTATYAVRQFLSRYPSSDTMGYSHIDIFINANVVPKLVEFLSRVKNPDLQFESVRALGNIASGTSDHTKAVVSAGAVGGLISFLGSPDSVVANQAVWALGNIAVDGPELRDYVIEQGIINPLINLIKPNTLDTLLLRNVAWTLSYLCLNKIPPPSVPLLLPALAQLIHNDDEEILVDACSALSYLTDSPNELIQEVVDAGIVPQLITLLDNTKVAVISATLRTVSKIAAGNAIQIQALFTNNVVRPLMDVLGKGDFECQKEAAWVITNITSGGTFEQIALLQHLFVGVMDPLYTLLEDASLKEDSKTISVLLDGLANILAAAETMGDLENVSLHVEECYVLDRIELLHNLHDDDEISDKALAILEQYFPFDVEMRRRTGRRD